MILPLLTHRFSLGSGAAIELRNLVKNLLLFLTVGSFVSCDDSKGTNARNEPANSKTAELATTNLSNGAGGIPEMRDQSAWDGADGQPLKINQQELIDFLNEHGSGSWDLAGDNGGYLRSLFFWCDAEHADQAMAILAKCKGDTGLRRFYLQQLVQKAFGEGGPGAFKQVQASIERHFGSGTVAADAVSALYTQAGFTPETIESLKALKDEGQRKRALAGLSFSLQYTDSLDSLASIKLSDLTENEKRTLSTALAFRVANADALGQSPGDLLREAVKFAPDSAGLVDLLGKSAANTPEDVWGLLAAQADKLGEKELASLQKTCVAAMAIEDGAGALDQVLQNTTDATRADLLTVGMLSYLSANDVAAAEWFEENKGKLNSREVDAVEAAFAYSAVGKKEFVKAWEKLAAIEDEELKRKAEGEIWKQEKKQVIAESRSDPQAVITSIVSGESQHAPYWMETVMNEWIAKDSEAAWAWYELNGKSLTPEQNEAVALTYARQALKDGQKDLAAQWAAQVVTPKFKQKIADELAEEQK